MSSNVETIQYRNSTVVLIDQRRLPREEVYVHCKDYHEVASAIHNMVVRGAPAIGVTAAFGIALAAKDCDHSNADSWLECLESAAEELGQTRPTAVNLFWAIGRCLKHAKGLLTEGNSPKKISESLLKLAHKIHTEDINMCRQIGNHGAKLIHSNSHVLTHCNAGALATAGYGTAAGVIRSAHAQSKIAGVWVDETRPFLQGARLTAWELQRDNIPVTLISDSMAGYCMQIGKVDCVVVGSDRIARNGDVANKIGTYTVAVLARENNIPFYVAAPTSTIDFSLTSGENIPIEERKPEEVTHISGLRIAPEGINVFNPAFDVTPAKFVDAIVTERGIVRPSRGETLEIWAPEH